MTHTATRRVASWMWHDRSVAARMGRMLLAPASWLFAAGVAWRTRRYDRLLANGASPAAPNMPVPAISIGNLSVGGTGKTPVASWFASEFLRRGVVPGIVLRGYGDDEWRVHQLLTPGAFVVCDPDRVRGAQTAAERGAEVIVLDDAFQHRRARRCADVVLVSADQWEAPVRLLPTGPYREGLSALRRASAVVITVKGGRAMAGVNEIIATIDQAARGVPVAVVRIVPEHLCRVGAHEAAGRQTLAEARAGLWGGVSGIGNPRAFEEQLREAGLQLAVTRRYPDHHPYSAADVANMLGELNSVEGVICTLKDAVKLAPLWPPHAPPLWYVSQTLVVERGAAVLVGEVDRVLASRPSTIPTSG